MLDSISLAPIPINNLLKEAFFIPSYQRGYRWTSQQVKDLLDDIIEFADKKNSNEFYCLQPIVVKKRDDESWELIDGQQRLTTIYIILSYLNSSVKYSIKFETRAKSTDFLAELTDTIDDSNIDFYHISKAYITIKNWFEKKAEDGNNYLKDEFRLTLVKDTKVIWYKVDSNKDSIDIFTRLNMGKIPLTNAELVKALFLKSENFEKKEDATELDVKREVLRQSEISREWDLIEQTLQDDNFWYFLNKSKNKIVPRIEFLFDLMASSKYKNYEHSTFHFFVEKFAEEGSDVFSIWTETKKLFLLLREWYENRRLFHLIGYLITIEERNNTIKDLIELSHDTNKSDFEIKLKELIEDSIRTDKSIDDLEYGEDNAIIQRVLLLFNIISMLNSQEIGSRFSFERLKNQSWSLEHIHAQNTTGLNTTEQWTNWIKRHIAGLKTMDKLKYKKLREELEKVDVLKLKKDDFDRLFDRVTKEFLPSEHSDTGDNIQNLALLDQKSNSSLGNDIFGVKRGTIIKLEKKGAFIPVCTRNVFLKYYSEELSELYLWQDKDQNDYLSAIKESLKPYIRNDK